MENFPFAAELSGIVMQKGRVISRTHYLTDYKIETHQL